MKKLFCICFCVLMSFNHAVAQTDPPEPDFIGEVLLVGSNGETQLLQKQVSKLQTRASASMYIIGLGEVKSKLVLDGVGSTSVIDINDDFSFIVRAVDNDSDPLSIIKIFKFTPFSSSNTRKAEISSAGTFSGIESNNDYLPFTAKKYGEHSYLIKLTERKEGEYGITVNNPNNVDEKQIIVSSFSLVDMEAIRLKEKQAEEERLYNEGLKRAKAMQKEANKAARKKKREREQQPL